MRYPNSHLPSGYQAGSSLSNFVIGLLCIAIVVSAIAVTVQVYNYRQIYKALQREKRQYHALQMENQRLLLEQQTFSATPQVHSRAVIALNMFPPKAEDKVIVPLN